MQTKANSQAVGAVTEEDIKAVLRQSGPIKSHDLVSKFKSRLMTPEVSIKDKQGTLYNYLIIYVGLLQGLVSCFCSKHDYPFLGRRCPSRTM